MPLPPFQYYFHSPSTPAYTRFCTSEPRCSNRSRYLWALKHLPVLQIFFFLLSWPPNINNSACPQGATSLLIWRHSPAHKRSSVTICKVTEGGNLPASANETHLLSLPCSTQLTGHPGDLAPGLTQKLSLKRRLRWNRMSLGSGQVVWREDIAVHQGHLWTQLSESLILQRLCHWALSC